MGLKEITLDGIRYLRAGDFKEPEYKGDIKIVVLQRGWVLIGRLEKTGSECKLHNASTIRNWGTKNGLGELAKEGKKSGTILDKCNGVVEFDSLTMVLSIAVNEVVWKDVL